MATDREADNDHAACGFRHACQKDRVEADAPSAVKVGPAYASDGKGGYVTIPKEQAACQMMRGQIKRTDTQCNERVATRLGLSVTQCREYLLQIANVCEERVISNWEGDYSFRKCMSGIDQTTMCTITLASGCKYSQAFADEVDGLDLSKNRARFREIMKRRCENPNPMKTLEYSIAGSLELMLRE